MRFPVLSPRALSTAAVAAISTLLAGCGPKAADTARDELAQVRFQTDWYAQAEHGGHYQALARGFYREAGLDVDIIVGGPGATVPQKMLAGQVEIGMGRSDDIIVNVSNGLPVLIVAALMQHDPQGILLHAKNPIRSFEELDGATIMAVPGANWIAYLRAHYGIDFKLIPLNYSLVQFLTDKSFIQQCFITNEPFFVEQHGAHPKTLLIASSGYDPYRVIFTTRKFARENPEAVRAFVAASIRGWTDFMSGDPTPGKALIAGRNDKMSTTFMDYSITSMAKHRLIDGDPARGERTGLLTRQRLQEQVDLLVRLGIIPEALPLEKFATFEFLPAELQPLVEQGQ
ncbi:MAG TPA: ABC transporter substrate-binding protein [Opitutaceae bacterium]